MNSEDNISPEMVDTIQKYFGALNAGLCPTCGAKVEEEQQIGCCVYAKPCGHRLFHGTAKRKEPKEG